MNTPKNCTLMSLINEKKWKYKINIEYNNKQKQRKKWKYKINIKERYITLQHSYWVYRNQPSSFLIEKMPVYLEKRSEEGDTKSGKVTFHSTSNYDEIWGADVKFDVTWELADRMTYNQAKKVRETIKMFNAIDIAVLKKETEWVRSHEMTYWYGGKKQIIQKRFYSTSIIHGIVLCEQTSRVFETHAVIVTPLFPNYEQLVLDAMRSLKCHEA